MKTILRTMSESDYHLLSRAIANQLYQLPEWGKANLIGITISNHPEVDTREIIERAWKQGKEVAVPKCFPADKSIQFRKIVSFDELEKVYYGLWEPIMTETEIVSANEIGLLVVPGLAFTESGYRLGFGGGYYDRFLPYYKGPTLSLAFKDQILPALPVETHDIPVAKLVTPEKVFVCNAE
ncbi:5-formyltetrahydrofolate cyclo-ligase [Bacillus sp. V59.32b]|nr:5-formyltetrahydrofolate cyclo-ligase [Bacillus sp. V59.32b]